VQRILHHVLVTLHHVNLFNEHTLDHNAGMFTIV
jgi:hypothetical protein